MGNEKKDTEILTPEDIELRKLYKEIDERYERIMCIILHKAYGVDVSIIDDTHVSIDGEVMNDDEFGEWLMSQEGIENLGFPFKKQSKPNYDA